MAALAATRARPWRGARTCRCLAPVLLLGLLVVAAAGPGPALAAAAPRGARAADSLALAPASSARTQAFRAWAARAPLDELVWILRRPSAELGALEPQALEAALRRTPASRRALGSRLRSRLAISAPGRARASLGRGFALQTPRHPWASVFRVGVVLPDSGDYREEAAALRLGIGAGLAARRNAAVPAPEVEFYATRDERPDAVATAYDWAAQRCGSLVGSIVDPSTLMLAMAAHVDGIPLVAPGATAEDIGGIGAPVWQIGPPGYDRGVTLARAVVRDSGARVGILVSSAAETSPFVSGFAAGCSAAGARVVLRATYPGGSVAFAAEIRVLIARGVELLFWDGDAREAVPLLRQLMRERVSLRVCGGAGLAPERQHQEARLLLEGVQYVPEDWGLTAPAQALLDSVVHARTGEAAEAAHVRGYLAGRFLGAAVAAGALAPEEIEERLAERANPDPVLRARRFLDARLEGAELPVYQVSGGRPVRVQ